MWPTVQICVSVFFIAVGFEDAGMKITGSNLEIFVTALYVGVYHWL